ncbi:hypothetical protein H2198_006992 [Neophaeococcomyces mojaviensis]|uniref:Uncharacterized protein n=1 Tax=Neophaeococcomyces mojaviensis TaxID=3383035 RepID=A0ACC3A1S3_9EURO|nr:hypothetical protein H2198_006992 [Knufia sp. JES_112]
MARPHSFLYTLFAVSSLIVILNAQNETRYNPAIPGWHSDPSCVFVPDWNETTFCTSSTFLLTPGLPIHASQDLVNWKLISHALSRKNQYPAFDQSLAQTDGIWAATVRYHQGTFFIITMYKNNVEQLQTGLIFNTTDPYDNNAWNGPIRYETEYIDPDLFWDDDGTAYVATSGINLQTADLTTGTFGESRSIWNGSTGVYLEGPHLYKKDGYYYILAAEGGSGINHTVIIARSKHIFGPYENHSGNPVLTNKNTSRYFQNVGHADLFQDALGHWWASALAWRSGPLAVTYPMGRETVLTPVTWNEGAWPIFSPICGIESGWYLPVAKENSCHGTCVGDADIIDFEPGSPIPSHFGYWRWPVPDSYTISPSGHPGTLQLTPSPLSISAGYENLTLGYQVDNLTLIMRLQTDTLFQYSVDVFFTPEIEHEEVGVTLYLNQVQNMALGVIMLPISTTTNLTTNPTLAPHLRFVVSGLGGLEKNIPKPFVTPVPDSWLKDPIRLFVRAENETHYTFTAASSSSPYEIIPMGIAPATIVSGGTGDFTGSLVGAYATTNGRNGSSPAYISRWRYQGLAQAVGNQEYIPSRFNY